MSDNGRAALLGHLHAAESALRMEGYTACAHAVADARALLDLRDTFPWLAFLAGYLAAWGEAGGDRTRTDLARVADVAYREWLAKVADEDGYPLPDTTGIELRHEPVEEMDDELRGDA